MAREGQIHCERDQGVMSLFADTGPEMGGFDETFVLHAGQDTDLSFRLRRAGAR